MSEESTSEKLKKIRKAPPPFRRVEVRSTELLSPRMLRIVFGSDELDGFEIEAPASSVRILVPPSPSDELVMPEWTGNQFEMPDGSRAPIRTFTPRAFDRSRNELTVDVVLHAFGHVTDWARDASAGDVAAISGPGRADPLPEAASHLLVGDESAIPAIAQLLEAIPLDRTVEVHVEVTDIEAKIVLPEHEGATVTWHVTPTDATPGDAMVSAAMAVEELSDDVWVAGEAAAVQRLRKYLFDECGRARSSVTARGYWKHGRAET